MKLVNQVELEQLTSQGMVLVDFFATWCGPCKMLTPVLEELQTKYQGKIEIVKVDVDQEQDLAAKYQVMAVPTMLLFKNGEVVKQIQGFQAAPQLSAVLDAFL